MVYGTQITIVTGVNLNQLSYLGGLTLYPWTSFENDGNHRDFTEHDDVFSMDFIPSRGSSHLESDQ